MASCKSGRYLSKGLYGEDEMTNKNHVISNLQAQGQ